MAPQQVDSVRLRRWLNVRKLTPALAAAQAELNVEELLGLLAGDNSGLSGRELQRLSDVLDVQPEQLRRADRALTVLVQRRAELMATRRPIERDGIHFYNYYSLPAPRGRVAPVLLDILCPQDRIPKLNNGHIEPALTLNVGPGPIHGRWGEQLEARTWGVLESNDGALGWITGSSYVEPSFRPHSYSLASQRPARIVSYTAPSALQSLVEECDTWTDAAFDGLVSTLAGGEVGPLSLAVGLARRGYDLETTAAAADVSRDALQGLLEKRVPLELEEARKLGAAFGLDYRTLLPRDRCEDSLGRSFASVEESRSSARRFRSYEVASMACVPHLPDLVGLFMRIEREGARDPVDLVEHGETHYLVTAGTLGFHWVDDEGQQEVRLAADDAIWVGPYIGHGFVGRGSVLKLGHGGALDAGADLALDECFESAATLRRARHDRRGWGFDGEHVE
jgi:hypothetical protein